MVWEYSNKTTQLFLDAVGGKPGTHLGEIKDPDGLGEHGSIACGDALRFAFKVKKHPTDPTKDIIVKARYLTFGCTSAIAASEALCAIIEKGQYTPIEALKINNKDIVDYLEGLPVQKIHCSVMGAEALEAAVFNWAQKRGVDLKKLGIDMRMEEKDEGRIVCKCFNLTEPYIKRKIKELNLNSIPEITAAIKAGGGCTACHHAPGGLHDLLNEVWGDRKEGIHHVPEEKTESEQEVSMYKLHKKIEQVIDKYVRPVLQHDGGDLEVVDMKGKLVYCRLKGACAGCPGAQQTLKLMVEKTLKDLVDPEIRIIAV